MSYTSYSVHGFGLILYEPEVAQKIAELNGYPDVYELATDREGRVVDDWSAGATYKLIDERGNDTFTREFEEAPCVCFHSVRQPKILTPAYSSLEEIEKEFKARLKFPDDFDIKAHLGYFSLVEGG